MGRAIWRLWVLTTERSHRAIRRAGQNPGGQLRSIGRLPLLLADFRVPLTCHINCITWRLFSYYLSYLLWILRIHRFHICEFSDLLNFICRPQIDTHRIFMVIHGCAQSGKKTRVPDAYDPLLRLCLPVLALVL